MKTRRTKSGRVRKVEREIDERIAREEEATARRIAMRLGICSSCGAALLVGESHAADCDSFAPTLRPAELAARKGG